MGLITKTARRLMAQPRALPLPSGGTGWLGGIAWQQPLRGERDYMRDVGDGSENNAIGAVVDFIANQFMEAPVQVLKASDLSEILKHPMTEKIKRPNPFYSGTLLWMATIIDWLIDGNGYWLKRRAASNGVAEYWWAPHWTMEPKGSDDGMVFITHYEYRPGGAHTMFKLAPSEVVHYRWGLDPKNPRKGQSRVKRLLREIFTDEEAARFTAALLRNMGAPGMLLSPKGETGLTPAEGEDVKADIIQKTTGDHRGEPLVMLTPTELQDFGFSPQQMDLAAIRSIPESRIAAAFGIPAAVVGFLTGMKQTQVGATLSELRQLAYESGIAPKQVLFADELATQALPDYTDLPDQFVVKFDLSKVRVLQEDENKRSTRILDEVSKGARSLEEGRSGLGLDPEFTPGDRVLILKSVDVVPVEMLDTLQEQRATLPQPGFQIGMGRRQLARPSAQQAAFLRGMDHAEQRNTAIFAEDLRAAFAELGDMAAVALERSRFARMAQSDDEKLIEAIISALDVPAWRKAALVPLFGRQYQRMAFSTFQLMGSSFDLGFGTDLPDPIALEVVSLGGKRVGLVDIEPSTRQALFNALTEAREEGMGPADAARLIRRYVGAGRFTAMEAAKEGSGVRYRADLIARTETKFAQNVATAEAGKSAGFTRYLAFDNRTGFDDEECMTRDGTEYSYDQMLLERDGEHPNGTLSFSPVPGSQAA